jgi:plastocyanin
MVDPFSEGAYRFARPERRERLTVMGQGDMQKKHLFTSAFALLALGAITIPATADARGVHIRDVRLQDRCDPDSFNAAIPPAPGGPPTCVPHGGQKTVLFSDFIAKVNPVDFGHPKWNNHPDTLELRSGDEISVTVRGGEFHTFTEVPAFGPGCIPLINSLLGLTSPAPTDAECGAIFGSSGVAPDGGSTLTVAGLAPGTHMFECFIHPWMRTVVTVD